MKRRKAKRNDVLVRDLVVLVNCAAVSALLTFMALMADAGVSLTGGLALLLSQ